MDDVVQLIMARFENEMHELDLRIAIDNAVNRFKQQNCQNAAIPYILQTIEKYPHLDWGTPGAFAHYMEVYLHDDYVENLLKSYRRKPTANTAFLVYRCANQFEDKAIFLEAFQESLKVIKASHLKEDVEEYLEWLN